MPALLSTGSLNLVFSLKLRLAMKRKRRPRSAIMSVLVRKVLLTLPELALR
ncbi:MAG TPA: hypothetical protein [Caudoviricetes sp.]|nr:MAG TPA: hypothetical protein [Caudoviricetes sp.]